MFLSRLHKKYRLVIVHALVWLIFIFFGTLNRVALNPGIKIRLADIFLTQLPSVYVFYGSSLLYFKFLDKKRYFLLIFGEIVFFLSYVLLTYIDGYKLFPHVSKAVVPPPFHLGHFFIECFWVFFLYSFFSVGYFFAMQTIRREKELRIAREKELRVEQDKLMAEYSFLRSQINPHFLHNTLNFLYAKSLGASQELSEGILTLSEVMRYSLEDSFAKNESVSLTREVENLRKVVKINQLRFSNRLNIDLSIEGNLDCIRIIPLVVITLVENALKHGELSNAAHPVVIRIEVREADDQNQLFFSVHNKKKSGPKELGYGIGMDNVKKRLEYTYHNNHRIIIKEDKEFYNIELSIAFPKEPEVHVLLKPLKNAL